MKGRVTAFEVAARAGVSQPTVSRALRDDPGVNRETRERIRNVARELGYRPDRRAAALRGSPTRRIAVIILSAPDGTRAGSNPFYMSLLAHIAAASAARGYEIIVSFQHDASNLQGRYQEDGEADGMIVLGASRNTAGWRHFAEARRAGANVVGWGGPDDAIPTIRCDNRAGAQAAVDHLVDTGRRRIAFIGPGWRRHRTYAERRAGYVDAMRRHDLPLCEATGVRAGVREEEGFASTRSLIAEAPRTDAIFAACDLLAMGAVRAIGALGRVVPRDVAVVGFDGIAQAAHLCPSLTTVEQDAAAAGIGLVDAVLEMASGSPFVGRDVPARLVERESSLPAAP